MIQNKPTEKLASLIAQGEKLVMSAACPDGGIGVPVVSRIEFDSWMGEVNTFNERQLKMHPQYDAIHAAFFTRRNHKRNCEEMVGLLKSVAQDIDYWETKNTGSLPPHNSLSIKEVTDLQPTVFISHRSSEAKVADMLRRSKKPVVLVVNKVDNFDKYMPDVYEFYNLGIGEPVPISSSSMLGLGDMLDRVTSYFPARDADEEEDDTPRIAIIGKPNVGKSSLVNKLCGENRVIVSNIAGTTRDAIDTRVKFHGKEYIFIDTAGLRRKSKIKEELERFSIIRAVAAVEKADVVIIMIDATEGVTEQDAKIAGIAHDRGKGIIIAVNKWDAIEKNNKTIKEHTDKIRQTLSFMPYAQIMFISVKTGQRLNKIYETIDAVIENNSMRVGTGVLNEIVTEAVALQQPPSDKGRRLKIFYTTQVAVKPPTFVIFVNDKELMHFSYVRYLENRIRDAFGFEGTSLKFIIRERKED